LNLLLQWRRPNVRATVFMTWPTKSKFIYMKSKRFFLVLLAAALFTLSARAEVSESHRAAIERLFTTLKVDKQYEVAMIAGFESGAGLDSEQMASLPEEQRAKVKAAIEKMKAKMLELMGWDKVKPDMIELYAKHFSEAEVKDITKLMESPTGQLLVTRQLALVPESMALAQKRMQAVMPQLMQVMQDGMK
jgi:hypothetical protein